MTVLDIDIGNTLLKWRASAGARGAVKLSQMGAEQWPEQIKRVRVASVAGDDANQCIAEFTLQQWGVEAEFARTQSCQAGVTNSYADPSRMGVDRWLAILSGWHRARQACWVVDCGSAITVEQIDDQGCHIGGYIIPGLQLMSRNLLSNTAEIIVDHSLEAFDSRPGVNTSEAVQHGINLTFMALAKQIRGMAGDTPLYVTGGDGELFCSLIEGAQWCPDLVMDGLELALG